MLSKYTWLLLPLLSIYLLYKYNYLNDSQLPLIINMMKIICSGLNPETIPIGDEINVAQKVFTLNELQRYTNLKDGLYISILGQVYDVTKGAKHYGPGATYHAFTGRDASLAFITGEFDKKGLTDDISSLSVEQVKALNDWVQFYDQNYIYKGKLKGRYYNEDGSPTIESQNVQKKIILAKEEKFEEEQRKRMFPPCNVEWNAESGTVVWCTKRSGGIERDWVGVPRMLFESPTSQQYRCACVKLDSRAYKETKGSLREYIGCPESSTRCSIRKE